MSWLNNHLDDLLLLFGAACIVWGVAEIHVPTARIVAGVILIAFAFLITKERADHASSEKPD